MVISSAIKEVHLVRNVGNRYKLKLALENGIEITFGDWHYVIAEDWIFPTVIIGDTIKLGLIPAPPREGYSIIHSRGGKEIGKFWFDDESDQLSISGMQNIINLLQSQLQEDTEVVA